MRPGWLWMGAAAFAELLGGGFHFSGIAHSRWSVSAFLHYVDGDHCGSLARMASSLQVVRVSHGATRYDRWHS